MSTAEALSPAIAPDGRSRFFGFGLAVLLAVGFALVSWDWLGGLAILLLWAGWRWLGETDRPPVLALAFTFQWSQVAVGPLYCDLTGRRLSEMQVVPYQSMMLLALVGLLLLLVGLRTGLNVARRRPLRETNELPTVGWRPLLLGYALTLLFGGALQAVAFSVPGFTQVILVLPYFRLLFLFLILRRLFRPPTRWVFIALTLVLETLVGLTGYFGHFKDPIFLGGLALIEGFDHRRAAHWIAVLLLGATTLVVGAMWTGIKSPYRHGFRQPEFAESREARLAKVSELAVDWFDRDNARIATDVDRLVSRLWAIPIQARAFARVPALVPHQDGALLWKTIRHLFMPRLFFPEKQTLEDEDSNMVRRYSGLQVAGFKQGTSIAFGYLAESYVDFGIAGMFFPVLIFAFLFALATETLVRRIRDRELAVAVLTTICWSSVSEYERSWTKTMGSAVTFLVVMGGIALAVDRLRFRRARREAPVGRRPESKRSGERSWSEAGGRD